MALPVVVLTDAFSIPFDSNQIDALEGMLYPVVFDVSDPDHPGAHFADTDFYITGPDADLFYIVDYQLIFQYEPDYENPIDSDTDSVYAITVEVTDSDGETTNQDIYINIFDDPTDNGEDAQPPQFVSDPFAVVPENIDDVAYIAQVDDSGPGNAEDVTFAIVGGLDGDLFSIDPVTGEVFFNQSPDFENPADADADNTYDILIEATNQSGDASQLDVAIIVTDENDEAPQLAPDAAVTVPENYTDVVYIAEATDADAESSVTYAITGGADMDKLSINELTGEVSFNQTPDFDIPGDADGDNTYEIEIVATDDAGNESQIQSVTVTVEDLSDETPVITSTEPAAEILENSFDLVYTVEATDADASDTVTFRFADDSADAGYFMIDEFSGAIYLNMPLDYESPQDENGDNIYELAIIASDDGGNDSEAFTLSVTILNENDNVPVIDGDDAITVAENTIGPIHTVLASDADGDALDYTVGGADAHLFVFDPTTGELSFITPPDFETPLDEGADNIYDVEITASDGDYTSDALAITIEVTDDTESGIPPIITTAPSATVAENTIGTVYTAQADDPDSSTVTFSISGGADAGLFAIDATSGELSFLNSPDYEAPTDTDADNVYGVEITASDGVNASDPFNVSIAITNENDNTPVMNGTTAAVTVSENITDAIFTAAASDLDGDTLQYILGGADALLFHLDSNTGELSFITPPDSEAPLDQGGDNIYDVEISATDGEHTSDATALSITVKNIIDGTPGPDTLVGTEDDDVIMGYAGPDVLRGGAGGDLLFGGLDNDQLDGEDSYRLSAHGDSVLRLYLATLERAPDVPGFNNWVAALDSGTPLINVSSGFVNSAEFQAKYGALDNTQFVTLLYNNALDRLPDAQGLANWVNALDAGASRESVVTGFSESLEFQIGAEFDADAFATVALNGLNFGQVFRVYQATLDRAPDAGGFENWTNARMAGMSLEDVTVGFVNSTEFQQTYGALDNTQFVTLLYSNVLDRAPDPGGLDHWIGLLDGGASRASVVNGFSESQEFIGSTDSAFTGFMQNSLPDWSDVLSGGPGDDSMMGGRGSDTFVFKANEGGVDHVYGLEAWDKLQFDGFGYNTRADALVRMMQSNQDVTFNDQGTSVIFHNTNLATLDHALLLV